MRRILILLLPALIVVTDALPQTGRGRSPALDALVNDRLFTSSHLGIAVYDAFAGRYVHQYQARKYFVPASNVKIFTCYAAMRYLDSILPGIRYYEDDTALYLLPTGDPSLLHRDFANQPVIRFLQEEKKKLYIANLNWQDEEIGRGWSWDDYNDEYMTERNPLPVYGNTIRWTQERVADDLLAPESSISVFSDPEVNWKVQFRTEPDAVRFSVARDRTENIFTITQGPESRKETLVPFAVKGIRSALELLRDTIGREIVPVEEFTVTDPRTHIVRSQPLDSILRPMMYRSDNFFAEQLLIMASGERLGSMNSEVMIDTILSGPLGKIPDKPDWVDGCGLSRYNLFTPVSIVAVLDSMRRQFGMDRLKQIFPTGDSGTLKRYFVSDNGYLYAKTGSMSGVLALSGYLYTRNGRLLIFSILINNYTGNTGAARRKIERFVHSLR